MEVVGSAETLVYFYKMMWHHIYEDNNVKTSLQC